MLGKDYSGISSPVMCLAGVIPLFTRAPGLKYRMFVYRRRFEAARCSPI